MMLFSNPRLRRAALLVPTAATVALAACAVGPNYRRPSVVTTPSFKESQGWKPAHPMPLPSNQSWWSIYNDPELDSLERQVVVSNQTLKQAEADYREAQDIVAEDRGTLFPSLSVSGSGTHGETGGSTLAGGASAGVSRGSGATSAPHLKYTTYAVQGQASWTLDIWGRIRRQVQSDVANAQASAADVEGALLSAQIALAEDYFEMRAAEQEERIYTNYIADLENSLEISQNQVRAGITTLADVYQAQTQLENTQVQAIDVQLTRATFEHAIAVLTGKAPAQLSIPQGSFTTTIPVVPVGVPSDLLERRPDVVAAEREVASANALIGVAESAWFPSLTLTGNVGVTGSKLAGLISASNAAWSVGPSLAETLFNGGARLAKVRQSRAVYDAAVAGYRQTVLSAFQSVENDLVALHVLQRSDGLQATAVDAAQNSEQLTLNQYKAGIVAYTSVITAQTARLQSELTLLSIENEQLVDSVDLISQIGGGWNASELELANRGLPAGVPQH